MKPSSAVRRAASSGPAAAAARRASASARARVAARSSRSRRVALARTSRSVWCRARRSRATCSPGARERWARWRARSITARRACTARRPARAATAARASPQCSGTAVSAAWVGVEQLTAATSSISVRSAWWPTEAMTGTRSRATVRHSVSSQKAKRSAIEPPPRATTTTSTSADRGEVLQRAADGRRGMAVLDRREGPDHAPRPAAAAQAGEHVVARLAALAGHDADAARQRRPRQALLRLEEPLGGQRPAQDLDLGEQVALAGEAQAADGERERRRRRARARVVVRAAGHDDLSAVGQRPRRQAQLLERVAPHRAGHGALRVAQLEPHAGASDAQAEDLAEQLHASAFAQLVAQLGGVRADGNGPRVRGARDALGTRALIGHSPTT